MTSSLLAVLPRFVSNGLLCFMVLLPLYAAPAAASGPWQISDEMEAWLDAEVSSVGSQDDRMRSLLAALERRPLVYDDAHTGTAEEVFRTHRYDCLGLAHLVVGLARRLGVDAYYVRVSVPDQVEQQGSLTVTAAHVAAGWGPAGRVRSVEIGVDPGASRRALHPLPDPTARAMHFTNRGAESLLAGEPHAALDWLDRAVRTDPRWTSAWVNRGVALRRLHRADDAIESYRRALALDPAHAGALKNLAALEAAAGNHESAHATLSRLAAAGHRNPDTFVALGDHHLQRGEMKQAHRHYRRARRVDPGSSAAMAARGRWHLASNDLARHSQRESDRVGHAVNSIVCQGSILSGGEVERSVIGNNVKVNSYSFVEGSILFDGVSIGRHAKIRNAIVDKRVQIPPGSVIGYDADEDRKRGFTVTENGVVVIASADGIEKAQRVATSTV